MHTKKLKILALHSFRTSAAIFKEQLERAGLLQALSDLIEVTFVDAPNPASGPIPDDVAPYFSGPYYEWWNANRAADGSWVYDNADTSLRYITEVARLQGPFDGLMGFSQGGAMAAMLAGMQRAGKALTNQPPLRLVVCFAGIRVRDPNLEGCYSAMRVVPSLHVIGDRDPLKKMTNALIESFDAPVVINHSRGHVIPPLVGADLQRMRAFFEAHVAESSL